MPYRDRLLPWCITHLKPNFQHCVVARFRRRTEAEAHLKVLRQMNPVIRYTIVFDVTSEFDEIWESDPLSKNPIEGKNVSRDE